MLDGFETTKGFPQAVDAIIRPEQSPADYYNRKGYYSILMQAVVDFPRNLYGCVHWVARKSS